MSFKNVLIFLQNKNVTNDCDIYLFITVKEAHAKSQQNELMLDKKQKQKYCMFCQK